MNPIQLKMKCSSMLVMFGIQLGNEFSTFLYLRHEDIKPARLREKSQDALPQEISRNRDSWAECQSCIHLHERFLCLDSSSKARLAVSALEASIIATSGPCHREWDRFRDLRSIIRGHGKCREVRQASRRPDDGINPSPQRDMLAALIEALIKSREKIATGRAR